MAGVNVPQVLAVAAAVTLMVGGAAAVGRAGIWLWQILRSLARLADDLMGEPARGHQPARLGVLDRLANLETMVSKRTGANTQLVQLVHGLSERLEAVEAQLKPNGGGSLRDAVDRLVPASKEEQ